MLHMNPDMPEEGVDHDIVRGLELWEATAVGGQKMASFNLGVYYEGFAQDGKPTGVAPDFHKALKYNRLAADQGHPNAMNQMGIFYSEPGSSQKKRGWVPVVKKDLAEATRWF